MLIPASHLPRESDQDFLLPPSLSEWLFEGHMMYFPGDSVDALDLSVFHARYEKDCPRKWNRPSSEDRDGGSPCSEIKEEERARARRGTFAEWATPVPIRRVLQPSSAQAP